VRERERREDGVGGGELQKKERKFARKLIILTLSASIKVVNFLQKKVKKKLSMPKS
jgi:hypothetical protein